MQTPNNIVDAPRATRREWIGLAVLAIACVLNAMDLTVLHADHHGHPGRPHRPPQAAAHRRPRANGATVTPSTLSLVGTAPVGRASYGST
jgi:hypothetical protein